MAGQANRKLAIKRFNEHVKLFVATVNAIAVGLFGAGVLHPIVTSAAESDIMFNWTWIAACAAAHVFAQAVVRLVQLE